MELSPNAFEVSTAHEAERDGVSNLGLGDDDQHQQNHGACQNEDIKQLAR